MYHSTMASSTFQCQIFILVWIFDVKNLYLKIIITIDFQFSFTVLCKTLFFFFEKFNISENNIIIVKVAKVCTMNMPRYALEY
jgi:hypothetical protein